MELTLCAPCLFGLESPLAYEVGQLGGQNVTSGDGKVTFTGNEAVLARANLWLRCAERVCVVLGSFMASSFEQLFDGVAALPFERFIGKTDAFPVKGWSLRSKLHSIPDCQSIIKRAAVRRFEQVYGQSWFEETGPVHQIQFSILKDEVTVMLDTSGPGLHKRGYRRGSGSIAPLKETLAAGIADLARLREDSIVVDPMCGSGTLLIEAALKAFNIAPGLRRSFAAEAWSFLPNAVWQKERDAALAQIRKTAAYAGYGYDIDEAAVSLTAENARKAGVGKKITVERRDMAAHTDGDYSAASAARKKPILLCNPPYGERLLELTQAEQLYRVMGKALAHRDDIARYIITPHEEFERLFDRKADKRRKLYNGMIKCQLYMYF